VAPPHHRRAAPRGAADQGRLAPAARLPGPHWRPGHLHRRSRGRRADAGPVRGLADPARAGLTPTYPNSDWPLPELTTARLGVFAYCPFTRHYAVLVRRQTTTGIGAAALAGLVLTAYQPDARLRIAAQYRRVGATNFVSEVSGARSIVETWHGIPNGYTAAQGVLRRGFPGCWVIALGTNDTANVAVGSLVGLGTRIRRMMALISPQPVMWVNVVSLLHSGPYAESRMRDWDRALLHACLSYPNMKVYDWSAVAKRKWFINDGIHYTPPGYAARSRMIANALAKAFPAGSPPPPPRLPLPAYMTSKRTSSAPNCLVH